MPLNLFRSLIDVDGKIEQDALLRNYSYLAQSAVSIADPDYISIWDYLQEYALDYSAMPSLETVRDHFTRQNDLTVLDRLEELERVKKTYKFTDFENLVSVMVKQQKDQEMMVLLRTAADILNDGMQIRQGRESVEYKGHRGSMQYLMEHAEDMLASERGFRTKSNLVQDTEEARTEFHSVLAAKDQTYGIITGLSNIDEVCRGIKPGDLWVHAGFTGELKCVSGSSRIFNHDTKRMERVEDLYRQSRLPVVTALYREGELPHLVRAPASHLVENGVRDVYTVTLQSGRELEITDNHPLWVMKSGSTFWVELKDLAVGDWVGVPAIMRVDDPCQDFSDEEIKTIGASIEDSIPAHLFGIPAEQVALLLTTLWNHIDDHDPAHATRSKEFGLGVQTLLLRLGIQSTVSRDGAFYVVRVVAPSSKKRFRELIVGERMWCPDFEQAISPRMIDGGCEADPGSDVTWDPIKSITLKGPEMTYDLSVPEHRSFVVNDVITHNTTFALNWVYRAVFLLQCNVYFLSLEMSIEHVRRIIYAMHANHPKWQGQGRPNLTYRLIRDGEDENGPITPEQIQCYEDIISDIEEFRGVSYGDFIVRSPDEDYNVFKLKADLEMQHNSTPLHMCVVDHFALMKPTSSTRNYYTDLNSILRDTKRLALTFNHGEKIPILGLLQINRQGKDDATKADGIYKMQALADSNEAERSSNVITTSYLDTERRAAGRVKFGCLKNRDGQLFHPFEARIAWGTRYIRNEILDGDLASQLEAESQEDLLQSFE